jgi:hypothetical protein
MPQYHFNWAFRNPAISRTRVLHFLIHPWVACIIILLYEGNYWYMVNLYSTTKRL